MPVNHLWLSSLQQNLIAPNVAAVYGRQIPTPLTHPGDKRDLWLSFGLDKKIQVKDPFLHNANSMMLSNMIKALPFDETINGQEDRLWAKTMIKKGYNIIYEPSAVVYHEHGIHHANNPQRLARVVKILEAINSDII